MKHHFLFTFIVLTVACSRCLAVQPSLWLWLSGHSEEAFSEIDAHKDIISQVSYGAYSVGSDGSLTGKVNLTIIKELQSMQIESWPLIGCGSTETLRELFSNPDPFIKSAVKEIVKSGFDGFNIDFEPYDGKGSNNDGVRYGLFLEKFAAELHKVNKKLSVDFFSNLPIWNLGAMNSSSTDYFISMDTYVQENKTFEAYLDIARSKLDGRRLGIGMCAGTRSPPYTPFGPDPCPLDAWTITELEERFEFLDTLVGANSEEAPFSQINMWVLPLGKSWWTVLQKYFSRWKKI